MLRYFLAAAREESITRAAESLHMAQPSLSKQLMELEHELGCRLLVRGRRKLGLTEEGLLLRHRAEEIVALFDKTEQEMAGVGARNIAGTVSIGGSTPVSVTEAAARVRMKWPDIRFHFHGGEEAEIAARLDGGSLDFAVFLEPVDTVTYEGLALPDVANWGVLVRSDSPLAERDSIGSEELRALPLIFHHRAGLQRRFARWARTELEKLNIVATYNVLNGSPVPFVKSGLGVFVTCARPGADELESGVCYRPLAPDLVIPYALVWKRHVLLSRAAGQFLEQMRDAAGSPGR
ncbi:MAG: LysR family transcriptional regulator [Desulfovibrionaceae bacterium]|nr:LysR family transcriptional regulator [Desulfovibrionaceae bacterium]